MVRILKLDDEIVQLVLELRQDKYSYQAIATNLTERGYDMTKNKAQRIGSKFGDEIIKRIFRGILVGKLKAIGYETLEATHLIAEDIDGSFECDMIALKGENEKVSRYLGFRFVVSPDDYKDEHHAQLFYVFETNTETINAVRSEPNETIYCDLISEMIFADHDLFDSNSFINKLLYLFNMASAQKKIDYKWMVSVFGDESKLTDFFSVMKRWIV